MNSEFEQIEAEIIVLGAFYAAAIITLVMACEGRRLLVRDDLEAWIFGRKRGDLR